MFDADVTVSTFVVDWTRTAVVPEFAVATQTGVEDHAVAKFMEQLDAEVKDTEPVLSFPVTAPPVHVFIDGVGPPVNRWPYLSRLWNT